MRKKKSNVPWNVKYPQPQRLNCNFLDEKKTANVTLRPSRRPKKTPKKSSVNKSMSHPWLWQKTPPAPCSLAVGLNALCRYWRLSRAERRSSRAAGGCLNSWKEICLTYSLLELTLHTHTRTHRWHEHTHTINPHMHIRSRATLPCVNASIELEFHGRDHLN